MINPQHRRLDSEKAKRIWAEYERVHDLTGMDKLAVGIDPNTGEVHFGTMRAIIERLDGEGRFTPLFYRWVNNPTYFRRPGRRRGPLRRKENVAGHQT